MRKIILSLAMILMSNICLMAQSVMSHDFADNSFVFIGNSKNSPKEKFRNAKSWIVKSFGDYKSVIQFEDAEECKLIIKGKLSPRHDMDTKRTIPDKMIIYYLNSQMEFTLTFEAKEDRYRLKFEDITVSCSEEKVVKLRTSHTPTKLMSMNSFCSSYEGFASLVKFDLEKLVKYANDAIVKESKDDDW